MMDLAQQQNGALSPSFRFSDLYMLVLASRFTGALLVKPDQGDGVVFFREGMPVHASGPGMPEDLLGDLLVNLGHVHAAAVDAALTAQQSYGSDRPLLGQLLSGHGDTTADQVTDAVRHQIALRVSRLFALPDGVPWQTAPGENERVAPVAVPTNGWAIVVPALKSFAAEDELLALSDGLLGKAVKLTVDPGSLAALALEEEDQRLLHLLEKPRKPHQLELVSTSRRSVRSVLKALWGLGYLELLSQKMGLAIKDAVKIPGLQSWAPPPNTPSSAPPPPMEGAAPVSVGETAAAAPAPEPTGPAADPALIAELKKFREEMREKSYFDILGVHAETPDREVRMCYTTLAKKFHPDAFGSGLTKEIEDVARAVAAGLNEAYQTLTDPEKKKKYVEMLGDSHIRGDARKAALVQDSKVKFDMGVVYLKKHEYQKARDYLKLASESDPASGLFKATWAWAIFSDPRYDRDKALEEVPAMLEQAIDASPENAQIYYYAGRVQKQLGNEDDAHKLFEKCVKLDKKHSDAQRELRLYEMRDTKKPGKKLEDAGALFTSLSKIFKR